MLSYKTIEYFSRGLINRLIKESYQGLFEYFPTEKDRLFKQWAKEDKDAFDNPETIGKCLLISCLEDTPIGYFSWDNRESSGVIIGQNCILPDFQKCGYGQKQIRKIENLFRDSNFQTLSAVTGDHKFFEPAQQMYLNSGFKVYQVSSGDLFDKIEYIKQI